MVFRFEVIVLLRVVGNVLLAFRASILVRSSRAQGQCGCLPHL